MRGGSNSACYVYASAPHITFMGDRIVVQVKTKARLGTSILGSCLGVGLSDVAEVSLVLDAEGRRLGSEMRGSSVSVKIAS